MSKSLFAYLLFALISFIFQTVITIYFSKAKTQYKRYLLHPIIISILLIPAYCVFITTRNLNLAIISKSFIYLSFDFIAFFMLNFSQIYIYYQKQTFRQRINIIMIVTTIYESILVVINYFHPIIFKLTFAETSSGISWISTKFIFNYIHNFYVAALILSSFLNLLVGYIKNPIQYKTRYLGVILAYVFIGFANAVSYSINAQYSISILILGCFIEFIFYYSTFIIPHHLLIQSLKNLNSTVDDAIIYFDNNGKIVYLNNSANDIFIENEVFTFAELEEFRKMKLIEHKGKLDNIKLTWNEDFRIFGELRHFYFEYEDVSYDNASIGSYFLIVDKTDEINKYQKEKYITSHDSLTGLYNESYFYEVVDEIIKNDPDVPRYMISTNIRDFKLINELFGQEFGNKVLKKQSEVFRNLLKDKSAVYCRLNDDKFAVLIEKEHFHEQMFLSAIEQIKSIFDNRYTHIHFYIGVCDVYKDDSASILVDKTKVAIEMGNQNFIKTFFYYDSLVMEKILMKKNIISEFKNAIINNEIKVFLQPIVDIKGNIKGAEALSRWENPIRGFMYPDKFIKILETNSMIYNLDVYVWEMVVKEIAKWKNKYEVYDIPFISVNVSDKDIYYIDIYNVFTKLVQENNIPPEKIILEFKESSIVSNVDRISKLFMNLREFGFKIAIDNYGTGYSSLNFLKNVQVDIVKVDMVFLFENEVFERSKLILQFLSQLANELGIKLVFEGVETLDQYKLIQKFGDVLMQGFYFSDSLTIENFNSLKENKKNLID